MAGVSDTPGFVADQWLCSRSWTPKMAGVVLILDLGVLDFGSWSFGFGSWFGLWILEFWILDLGFWILEFRFWILEFRLWILEFWILDLGVWILDDVDVLRKTIPDLWVTSLPKV